MWQIGTPNQHSKLAVQTNNGQRLKTKQDKKLAVDNCGLSSQLTTKENASWKSPLILQTFRAEKG